MQAQHLAIRDSNDVRTIHLAIRSKFFFLKTWQPREPFNW